MNAREWAILIAGVAICGLIVWDTMRLNRQLQIRKRLAEPLRESHPSVVGTWLARHPR